MCNNKLKFSYLIKKADELKCQYVATGHYAKVIHDYSSGEAHLCKASDHSKDQSYFLFGLKQEQLARSLMPLGDLLKSNVRKIAETFKLPVADKKDSQEICFIDALPRLCRKRATEMYRPGGPIISIDGQLIGTPSRVVPLHDWAKKGFGIRRC